MFFGCLVGSFSFLPPGRQQVDCPNKMTCTLQRLGDHLFSKRTFKSSFLRVTTVSYPTRPHPTPVANQGEHL